MTTDYYELLEVQSSATEDEIKKAYRRLARECHPDANPGDPDAETRFKEISVAYETLRDPERRRRYDMFGPDGASAGAGAGGFGPGGFDASQFGLNDLFDAFFGGDAFGRGRGASGPPPGPDMEAALRLTLDEVVFGAKKTIDLRMPVACETCDGSGCAPGTHPSTCSTCNGSGEVRQVRRSLLGQVVTAGPCPQCEGTGAVIPTPCTTCHGAGRVAGDRKIDIDVPAGIDEGQRLRLAGRGAAAARGGPSGDLYLSVRVTPHENFERRGDDLYRLLRVAMTQAALGTHFTLDTLDGPEELAVPPGTPHGRVFRLRGHGVPSLRSGRRGDLLVEIAVDIPAKLSGEEAELLAQFAALRGEAVAPAKDHGFFSRIRSAFQ
ncbi:MAG: DnaJ-class molecular chaperone with C-terminal Zn finger domain [Actinomycetia bacterium]|nr:DnaJ-class molecular chaperone with C-terminal Zn finger domain [Actinomycetes bacterium]